VIAGRFFYQFGIPVSVAVAFSMLVTFTLTPMLSSRFLDSSHGKPSAGAATVPSAGAATVPSAGAATVPSAGPGKG
jgi:multidrug efflux pump subunit AcrB